MYDVLPSAGKVEASFRLAVVLLFAISASAALVVTAYAVSTAGPLSPVPEATTPVETLAPAEQPCADTARGVPRPGFGEVTCRRDQYARLEWPTAPTAQVDAAWGPVLLCVCLSRDRRAP